MPDILEEYGTIIKKQYPERATFSINLDKVKTIEDIVKVLKFTTSITDLKFSNVSIIDEYDIEHLIDVEVDDWY